MSYKAVDMVFDVRGLDDSEFRLLAVLARYCQNETGEDVFPSIEIVMDITGWSNRKTRYTYASLLEKGRISAVDRAGGRGKRNHYNISFPYEVLLKHADAKYTAKAEQASKFVKNRTKQFVEAGKESHG